MLIERRADAVVAWAPAKINLFLEVLSRRPDGYHEIATLMVAVTLYDALVCEPTASDSLELTCDNETLSVGPDNLILQAGELLRKDAGVCAVPACGFRKGFRWPQAWQEVRPTRPQHWPL